MSLLLFAALAFVAPDLFAPDNRVAWCIVPFDAKKRSPEDRAAMLKNLGFKKYAYDWRAEHLPTFERELTALKANGVELTAVWFPSGLDRDGQFLLTALKKAGVKTQLWVMLGDPAPGKDQAAKVAAAAERIGLLADAAGQIGCRVSLYNHGGWGGEPENMVAIVVAAKRPNVGIAYNLHHGHDHLDRFPAALKLMLPHLDCFNLNGTVKQGDKINKKILPLGQGDLDLELLKQLQASGYAGPVGILGHTDDDAEARLKDNLDGLDWLRPQLDGKAPGPKPQPRTLAGRIRLGSGNTIDVTGLTPEERGFLALANRPDWPTILAIAVGPTADPIPGTFAVTDTGIRFMPRFPLTPGVPYRVTFNPNAIPVHPDVLLPKVVAEVTVPKVIRLPTTVVTQISPFATKLPENTLRLYVQFSAPMTRGEASKHLRLLDADGKPVDAPFLELEQELWSADSTRFTILFDPGRVKRGLAPREEHGPPLVEGKRYTLAIDRGWTDENGDPLKAAYSMAFTVGPPDEKPIDPTQWTITPELAGVGVRFEKPLDRALAARMIHVEGLGGKAIDGAVAVSPDGKNWTLAAKLPVGEYKLVIDTRLEDLCGNRVGESFEIDPDKPAAVRPETVSRSFRVK